MPAWSYDWRSIPELTEISLELILSRAKEPLGLAAVLGKHKQDAYWNGLWWISKY